MVLNENVRRLENEPTQAPGPSACINQSDGSSIAMTQQDRLLNLELAEQVGKHNLCFVVHKVSGALFRKALRFAMSKARVHKDPAAGSLGHQLREILPQGDGAEALVKHDNCGVRARRWIQKG